MIELDVFTYLKSDSTLDGLLNSNVSDSKIYPSQVAQKQAIDSLPYIIYNISSEGTFEENLREMTITYNCVSDNYLTARNIKNRLITLLDQQDKIRNLINSGSYYFYWCKHTGGTVFKDPDIDAYHHIAIFQFKYAEATAPSLTEIIVPQVSAYKEKVIYIEGLAITDDLPLIDYNFPASVVINKIKLNARKAPDSGNLQVDITRAGAEEGVPATLAQDDRASSTDITSTIFTASDAFGIKVLNGGGAAGVTVTINYY